MEAPIKACAAACSWIVGPDFLLYVVAVLGGGAVLFDVLILRCVRRVLAAGGPLEELGLGTIIVPDSERKNLKRWRVGLSILSVAFALLGTGQIIAFGFGDTN
eukprot:COSAG05_NODE_7550_length_798_cov_0.765379_2_plen_102_part_01